jgi:hypothetical protein
MDGPTPLPFRQVIMILGLVVVLVALAFISGLVIWRVTLQALIARLIADSFVGDLVYLISQIALAFGVLLVMLVGEPVLSRALRQGRLWRRFGSIAVGLIVFGLIGLGVGWLVM